jgi:hypothetical protein
MQIPFDVKAFRAHLVDAHPFYRRLFHRLTGGTQQFVEIRGEIRLEYPLNALGLAKDHARTLRGRLLTVQKSVLAAALGIDAPPRQGRRTLRLAVEEVTFAPLFEALKLGRPTLFEAVE